MDSGNQKRLEEDIVQLQETQKKILNRIERLEKRWLMYTVHEEVDYDPPPVKETAPSLPPVPLPIEPSREPRRELENQGLQSSKDLEFHIGGTWLNRIGVVTIIFGIAYFLKYSFDNAWIGPTGRVLLGVLSGMAMLIAGEKLQHRYPGYAQGLLGGGSLAVFFSIYAGYQFYDLISPPLAFSFMVVMMVYTVFMAVRHNSLAIGILGIVGGYTTPFLIGSDDPSMWLLYGYLVLLTAGVLVVSIYKKWVAFQLLSFVFNQAIFAITWLDVAWRPDFDKYFAPSFLFLVINFVFYLGIASVYNIRTGKKAARGDIGLILLNGFLFFTWSMEVLDRTFMTDYMGFYAVFLALVYTYLGKMANGLCVEDKGQVYSLFVLAFVLLTLAIPIQFSGVYVGLGWLAEAVGLTFMAGRLNDTKVLYGGWVVLALGLIAAMLELSFIEREQSFLFNEPTLMLAATLAAICTILKILAGWEAEEWSRLHVKAVLKGLFLVVVFIGLNVENHHYFFLKNDGNYFLSPEQLSLSALWTLYAIGLFLAGMYRKNRQLRYASLGLLAIVVLKAFFIDLANLQTVYKIILFTFLGMCLLGISFLYQKKKDTFREEEIK